MRGFLVLVPLLFAQIPTASHAAAIHDAATKGDVAAITAALDAGSDVDESDGKATPLYLAVKGGHLAAAKLLIERGADVNAAPTLLGPALMPALAKRRIDLIKLLLDGGANPNSKRSRENAIHIAVNLGCLDCVKALVEAGADVNAKTKDGKTPIHLARFKGLREIADYLMAHGVVLPTPSPISMKLATADIEKGRTSFTHLCAGCHSVEPQGANKTGPNLWGVVSRDKASVPNARYSATLLGWEGAWTYEDLNKYLVEPMLTTPGVYMEMPGVPDEAERVNVIAYLRTLSDKPSPLP
ncbi:MULTISPECIES: ankyrin repeat domain-containing protein [unclassified Mesorhizobium]|uniref:ankyrin repeat domain-containing protein n=2 Tax=unclassified Mesorhizobium TaxID=325217 RepID=UPI000FE8CC89|nr:MULTISPECIES: ankyrin repeat domain-containing protein [unclassified Mesorhizobium]RWF59780.1 MAG: c-type cytochrome [Mesorhizobium sp.]TGQ27889.1 c-type cytochrome [Mesorhizobium sp. M4B.F.Ca.ET.214.01.1.1]TGQ54967.1 c-type cytochrome [Mesorhizobium sp. M4B.F.Ca.ET.211.01.1.1]TGU28610.1 c-type cytochrome [Mesorhizobium sp. M4B.F.Ca.ET.150.01.1.1]